MVNRPNDSKIIENFHIDSRYSRQVETFLELIAPFTQAPYLTIYNQITDAAIYYYNKYIYIPFYNSAGVATTATNPIKGREKKKWKTETLDALTTKEMGKKR